MEWTDIKTTVPAVWAETAEAIATGISGGGIYICLLYTSDAADEL